MPADAKERGSAAWRAQHFAKDVSKATEDWLEKKFVEYTDQYVVKKLLTQVLS